MKYNIFLYIFTSYVEYIVIIIFILFQSASLQVSRLTYIKFVYPDIFPYLIKFEQEKVIYLNIISTNMILSFEILISYCLSTS